MGVIEMGILKMIGGWLLSALLDELKELWSDGTIKSIAKESVLYVQNEYSDNDQKAKESAKRIKKHAKGAGINLSIDIAKQLSEKAYNRWLKK